MRDPGGQKTLVSLATIFSPDGENDIRLRRTIFALSRERSPPLSQLTLTAPPPHPDGWVKEPSGKPALRG